MSLGVPEEMLCSVRDIASDEQLDALQPRLPMEAYGGLFLVAAGDTVTQVLVSRETRGQGGRRRGGLCCGLGTPESQSRFVVVSDDETLTAILNTPLSQWRVFLHPDQQKLAMGTAVVRSACWVGQDR